MAHLFCCLLFATAIGIARLANAQPEQTFQAYLAALKAADWQTTEKCWTPEAVAASKRLGITYTDHLPKFDNASPLVTFREAIIKNEASVLIGPTNDTGRFSTIEVTVASGRDSVKTTYYFEELNGKWLITTPLFLFTRDWRTIETDFARVHFRDSSLINQYALSGLDRWTQEIVWKFELTNAKIETLTKLKFDYYLGDADDVKRLTGFETYGMTNLQFDAVITQYLPHPHEMVHLLVDYALEEKPLYTMPFMQEGLASWIGGRWGKSPEVIRMMGSYLLRNGVVELDSVLTWSGFNQSIGMPDLTYPVSAVFVEFLSRKRGGNLMKIYQRLSASPAKLMSLSAQSIHDSLTHPMGTPWEQLKEEFLTDIASDSLSGIYPGLRPRFFDGEGKYDFDSDDPYGDEVLIDRKEGKVMLRFKYEIFDWDDVVPSGRVAFGNDRFARLRAKLPDESTTVTLLLTDTTIKVDPTYGSKLFAEHFPGRDYKGEWYGVRFTSRDAGIYNYVTNTLETKYVADFAPSKDYWDVGTGVVTFTMSINPFGQHIPNSFMSYVMPMTGELIVQKGNPPQ